MPLFESEKVGVIVLGCQFSEKAEHVPIKKRKFLFRTPSPPSTIASPCLEGTESVIRRQRSPCQGIAQNSAVESRPAIANDVASADLGPIANNDANFNGKNLVKVNERCDENEDFSGISILAAAACSHSLRGHAEEPFGSNSISQKTMNTESKDDIVNSAKISVEGIGSCVLPSPAGEDPVSLDKDHSSLRDLACENIQDGASLRESAVAESFSNKDDMDARTHESSVGDDRLHWDLNTVMDAWERPFDCQHVDHAGNAADGFSEHAEDGKHGNENKNSEAHELKSGPDNNKMKAWTSDELRGLTIEPQRLNLEEDKSNAGIDINRGVSVKGKIHSSEIDHTRGTVMDMDQNTEFLNKQEKIIAKEEPSVSSPAKHGLVPSSSGFVNENTSAFHVTSGTSMIPENLSSHCVGRPESTEDYSLSPESGHHTRVGIFEESCKAATVNIVTVESMEDRAAGPQTSRTIFFSSQPMEQNVAFPSIALSKNATCDIGNALIESDGDAHRSSELQDEANIVKNIHNVEAVQGPIADVRESATAFESDERSSQSLSNSAGPTTGAFLGDEPVAPEDTMVQHAEKILVHGNVETDSRVHIDAEEQATLPSDKSMVPSEPPRICSSFDASKSYHDDVVHGYGNAHGEALENGYDTEVSEDDSRTVAIEKSGNFQMDYDYHYEDGELRESIVQAWEEYDIDEDIEHVDYGLDNADISNLNVQSHSESSLRDNVSDSEPRMDRVVGSSSPYSSVQYLEQVESHDQGSGSALDPSSRDDNDNNEQDNVKDANQSADMKSKLSGWDCLPENHEDTSDFAIVKEGTSRKDFNGNQKDGSDAEIKMLSSKVKGREMLSHIERPEDRSVFLRRETLGIHGRSFNVDGSNPRSEREFNIAKSFRRSRDSLQRGRGGGHWAYSSGSERGLKRRRSPSYHGLASFHFSGPEHIVSDGYFTKEGSARPSRRGNNASHGLHRSFRRNGSPSDKQESFDMHRDSRAGGETGFNRFPIVGRGRSSRYGLRVSSRGPMGRYHGSLDKSCIESSLNYSHPWTRRRRKLSPIERRGSPPAYRLGSRSPSRSRARSPNAWMSRPRGRSGLGITTNLGFRHRSRSPNFCSGARMPRMRSPPMRTGLFPDHEIGFISSPRTRDSPPPNSRWIGHKQRSTFLDRRSPGRIGTRGDRFDILDNPRKLKSNECYRYGRPGRFSELNGVGRGGPRHNGVNKDRGKHGYRHELGHPLKRYDMEGAVEQLGVDNGYVAGRESRDEDTTDFIGRPKSCVKDIDSQIGDCTKV